jgi:hypothetical protein
VTSGPGKPSPGEFIRSAVAQTRARGTARLFSASRDGSAFGDDVSRIEGVADLARRVARVTVHHMTSELEREMQSEFAEPVDDPEEAEARLGAQAFIKMFRASLEHVYAGGATYTHVPDEGWANFRGTDRDGPCSVDNPLWLLDALLGARDDAVEVGTGDVRGTPTRHLRLTIDLGRADEQLTAGIVTPGPRSFRSLRGLPAEVWIDEQGLIRRMSYQSESGIEGRGEWWQTTELWDFGLNVQIRIPTEDELIAPSCAIDPARPEPTRPAERQMDEENDEIQVVEPEGGTAPLNESLSPEQLRAEAEKLDRLVQRHARHRVIGAAPEDHVPLALTTTDTRKLTERDRHTLAALLRKQSEIYQELAELLDQEQP